MPHDKVKAAPRRRMAATREPYAAARRRAIGASNADQVTWAVSAEDIRAAAEVHRELGPDYSDAAVASFIDKVDRPLAARGSACGSGAVEASKVGQTEAAIFDTTSGARRPGSQRRCSGSCRCRRAARNHQRASCTAGEQARKWHL
jgi:hypothetical protein